MSAILRPGSPAPPDAAREARRLFPRGLIQPEGTFRFSLDALLLAEFAAGLPLPRHGAVADLGAGCGAAGFGLMLARPDARVVGVEILEELARAATANAARLGWDRYAVVVGDAGCARTLADARECLEIPEMTAGVRPEGPPLFDAVIANPPWRRKGEGRVPPSPAREIALFGDADTLNRFFGAADRLLKPGGLLAAVCGADRLADALGALPDRLRPVRLRLVHSRPEKEATFVLLEAGKGVRSALRVDPPLFLDGRPRGTGRDFSEGD